MTEVNKQRKSFFIRLTDNITPSLIFIIKVTFHQNVSIKVETGCTVELSVNVEP